MLELYWRRGTKYFLPLKPGGWGGEELPCLEGGGGAQKVSDPRFSHCVAERNFANVFTRIPTNIDDFWVKDILDYLRVIYWG